MINKTFLLKNPDLRKDDENLYEKLRDLFDDEEDENFH
jgi:hypothetical protein